MLGWPGGLVPDGDGGRGALAAWWWWGLMKEAPKEGMMMEMMASTRVCVYSGGWLPSHWPSKGMGSTLMSGNKHSTGHG